MRKRMIIDGERVDEMETIQDFLEYIHELAGHAVERRSRTTNELDYAYYHGIVIALTSLLNGSVVQHLD